MMFILKLVFKIVAIPLVIAVTLVQWSGIFIVGIIGKWIIDRIMEFNVWLRNFIRT